MNFIHTHLIQENNKLQGVQIMRILSVILLITISTNAHAFYHAVTPENITGQAKMKCDSVNIHRRFNDLGNVINCGEYLNPKQQAHYVNNIQGQDMAKGWRIGGHSLSRDKVAMAYIEAIISSPREEVTLDIPVKPIELSGRPRPYTRRQDRRNNVHYTRGQSKGTVKYKKPVKTFKPTPTPKPLGNVHGTTTFTR